MKGNKVGTHCPGPKKVMGPKGVRLLFVSIFSGKNLGSEQLQGCLFQQFSACWIFFFKELSQVLPSVKMIYIYIVFSTTRDILALRTVIQLLSFIYIFLGHKFHSLLFKKSIQNWLYAIPFHLRTWFENSFTPSPFWTPWGILEVDSNPSPFATRKSHPRIRRLQSFMRPSRWI